MSCYLLMAAVTSGRAAPAPPANRLATSAAAVIRRCFLIVPPLGPPARREPAGLRQSSGAVNLACARPQGYGKGWVAQWARKVWAERPIHCPGAADRAEPTPDGKEGPLQEGQLSGGRADRFDASLGGVAH